MRSPTLLAGSLAVAALLLSLATTVQAASLTITFNLNNGWCRLTMLQMQCRCGH